MARIRTVKPEFWDDETVGALTRDARLLFIATWTFADDEGLLRWSPSYLKASALMYDDAIYALDVQRWMDELEHHGFVFSYGAGRGGQRIGYIVNFRKHQRIDKPQAGKLPPPPCSNPAVILMYARRDEYVCHICREPVNHQIEPRPLNVFEAHDPDISGLNPSPDHLIPRSKGGTDYPTNIKTAHVSCNKGRGNRSVEYAQANAHSRNIPRTLPEPFAEHSTEEGKGREGIGTGANPTVAEVINSNVEGNAIKAVQLPTQPWLNGSTSPHQAPAPRRSPQAELQHQQNALTKLERDNGPA